jgi:muramoyltetrapeptide carboxypeptidase
VLSSLVGTPFLPSFAGAVLLLEDVGERPYRLDRTWTQLALAGVLEGVAGVVLGDFTDCEVAGASYTSAQVLDELASALGVPCAAGFPVGHGPLNAAVPLGARVRLDARARRLEFLEGLTA